ncbi:hypothetical protein Unana1_02448 [Umbelopsis nana]
MYGVSRQNRYYQRIRKDPGKMEQRRAQIREASDRLRAKRKAKRDAHLKALAEAQDAATTEGDPSHEAPRRSKRLRSDTSEQDSSNVALRLFRRRSHPMRIIGSSDEYSDDDESIQIILDIDDEAVDEDTDNEYADEEYAANDNAVDEDAIEVRGSPTSSTTEYYDARSGMYQFFGI